MDMPLGAAVSTTPELDGPVYAVPSMCALMKVHIFLYYGGVDLGF